MRFCGPIFIPPTLKKIIKNLQLNGLSRNKLSLYIINAHGSKKQADQKKSVNKVHISTYILRRKKVR